MSHRLRTGPFSRLYGQWVDALAESGAGRLQILVILCLCERLEFDSHGNATAWYPRAELAERLEVSESTLHRAVSGLIGKKLLSVKRAGHKGRATVYNVFPGIPWPTQRGRAQEHQTPQRWYETGFVGGAHRYTPKTYRGGDGLTPAPQDDLLDRIASGEIPPRELW